MKALRTEDEQKDAERRELSMIPKTLDKYPQLRRVIVRDYEEGTFRHLIDEIAAIQVRGQQ